jgi:RimK family alpha-L-glutamate ligase
MHVVILSARTGWHTDRLCGALSARGHVGVVVPYEGLVARLGTAASEDALGAEGVALFTADAVLARIIPSGSLEQIIYRVDALHWIEERGIPVMNSPRAIERTVDKFYTSALLREAGLPVPETVVCERAADAVDAVRRMGDAIIKPIFGSMGHGLVRVTDPEVARRVAKPLEQMRSVFYVQRAIAPGGHDVRALVVGGRVVGAIRRDATPGEWRTNVSLGGRATAVTLSIEWAELAVRAAGAVGADYAGVDLLPDGEGGVYVLEVNGIPGWEGLQGATGVDVAGAVVDHLVAVVHAGRVPASRNLAGRQAANAGPTVPTAPTSDIR